MEQVPNVPEAFAGFIDRFNEGRYWESHEVLEASWRRNGSPFYKGMIIYASAFVHAQRGNPRGVRKQLRKARRYLEAYRPAYMGIDVDGLLGHLEACLAVVEPVGQAKAPEGGALAAAIPFPRLRLERGRLRGDEPELAQR